MTEATHEDGSLTVLYDDGIAYLYITGFEEDLLIPLPVDRIEMIVEALNEALKLAAIDAGLAEFGEPPAGDIGVS